MSIFDKYLENHVKRQVEFLTFDEYLNLENEEQIELILKDYGLL